MLPRSYHKRIFAAVVTFIAASVPTMTHGQPGARDGSKKHVPATAVPSQNKASDGRVDPEQQKAMQQVDNGNRYWQQGSVARAAEAYRRALIHWDHPAIHYNLGLVLIERGEWVEAYRAMQKALRDGGASLRPEQAKQAHGKLAMLKQYVGEIEIACSHDKAVVTLDGNIVFVGPGKRAVLVRVGQHQIVTSKRGYQVRNDLVKIEPGQQIRHQIDLAEIAGQVPLYATTRGKVVITAGIVTAMSLASGVTFGVLARREYGKSGPMCTDEGGQLTCEPPALEHIDRANRYVTTANLSFGVAGAAAVVGTVAWLLMDHGVSEPSDRAAKVVTYMQHGEAGVLVRGRF